MLGGVNTLNEQYISQDSAKQRSGRAGRTGTYIQNIKHLYS